MSATEINTLLRRRPFMPFRLHVTGDVHYDVRNPEMAVCGMSVFFLGQRRNVASEYFDELILVAIRHVTHIEPIVEADAAPVA